MKYFGVLIDLNFFLTQHTAFVTSTISESSDILSRFRHFVPQTVLTLYQSLVQPYLSNGEVKGKFLKKLCCCVGGRVYQVI